MNIIVQSSPLIVVSVGVFFVLLTGGIDLSVGSMQALASVLVGWTIVTKDLGPVAGFFLPILICAGIGLVMGLLIANIKVPSFIVTLAMMTIARGLALWIPDGQPVPIPKFFMAFRGSIIGLNYIAWVMIALVVTANLIRRHTTYGRIITAIGSNEATVFLTGIDIKKYKPTVYMFSGLCAGLSGIMLAARQGMSTPLIGEHVTIDAITGCVIGGVSLAGGEGTVLKTVFGVFVLALIENIMMLLAIPSHPRNVIKGVIIIAAVLIKNNAAGRKE